MRSPVKERLTQWTAAGIFLVCLTLYIITLAPSVVTVFDDSLEFQLVTYRLGIAHPTGYPLYTILGKIFTFLPVGDIAYRVNLMSALFGAAAVALLYLFTLHIIPQAVENPPRFDWTAHLGAVVGALLLMVSPVFWKQATIAEVYTLNAVFIMLIMLMAISVGGTIPLIAFLTGLALTHHRTILLLLPALALYLYLTHREKLFKTKTMLLSLLFGLTPLLLYLYLPLRGDIGSLDGTYQNSWAGFWQQVTASGYSLFVFGNPFGHERDAAFYWNLLDSQFSSTIPGFIGLFYLLWTGYKKMVAFTALAFLTYFIFNLFYQVSDIEVFFIPVFMLWAVWSGVGVAFLIRLILRLRLSAPYRLLRPVLPALFLVAFAIPIYGLFRTDYADISQAYNWQVHDYGLDMLAQPELDKNAAIVGILGEVTLVRYFQQTEGLQTEVQTIAADLEKDRLNAVERLLNEGKIVYLTRELSGVAKRWSLSAVGPLIRVNPEPVTTPPDMQFTVNQAVIPGVVLRGYNISRPPHTGMGLAPVRLNLFWQVDEPPAINLKLSVRLLDQAGQPVTVVDAVPVHFAYPTKFWRAGEIVSDIYDLSPPPGQYTPLIIWYDPAQNAAEIGRIELETVTVK